MADLPTGTVTFLFTDLEGSTRLWEEHPDAMKDALARHDEILRDAIAAHDGHVVKTTGDGVHAAFTDAPEAVRAAIDAQRELGATPWGVTGALEVRMGIHTGPGELRDGDYYGTALNRAARLMSAAHGGQILVSLAVEELVRDALPDRAELVDLGEHQLRDVARSEHVFQVAHPELRREFPELVTTASGRGNLPAPVTSFVGREDDIALVEELLETAPLVTVIGVGGVGKTRLALQVAARLASRFTGGAWFCDLAPVPDDESVALAIATSLRMTVSSGKSVADSVRQFIGRKHLLLVLDNCEHVIDAVGVMVDDLVVSCPHARILATSREGLAVGGEQLWPLRPLALPREGAPDATASAPVQLFVDRVRALRPDFALDETNTAAVLQICRHLDGLPLAIELAAARARSLSPHDIAERLDQRFSLLSGGRRRGLARHETLRAAVDWSYDLLDDDERAVLARVAVFAGGFTLKAAEAVAGDAPVDAGVLEVLSRLVDKSLVNADDQHETTRYWLLETIRQYALEKLDAGGQSAEARDQHLAYFTEFAESAGRGLVSPDELAWQDRTEADLDNIRAAAAWAVDTGNTDAALRLATAFSEQSWLRYRWGLLLLADSAADIDGATSHPLWPLARSLAAILRIADGDYDAAVAMANEALAAAGEDDLLGRAKAEAVLGDVALRDSRFDAAEHLERARDLAREAGNKAAEATYQHLLAHSLPNRGADHLDDALRAAEQARALGRDTGCPTLIGQGDMAYGYVLTMRQEPGAVAPLVAAAALQSVNRSGALAVLALYQSTNGTPLEAVGALEDAVRHGYEIGDLGQITIAADIAMPLLMRYGDAEAGAVVLGSISGGALPRAGRSGLPGERRARSIARMRERLGEEAFSRAQARGVAMSYEEIMDFIFERITVMKASLADE
jgi:predicted ATPase/class 3 adenylate cyclase